MPVGQLSIRSGSRSRSSAGTCASSASPASSSTQKQGRETLCRLRLAAFEELHEVEARLIGGTSGVTMSSAPGPEVPDVG